MKIKTARINKAFWPILENMGESDLTNSYFGGANLVAEFLNDYSQEGINDFIANWLDENLNKNNIEDLETSEIINNPDSILQYCSYEFYAALSYIIGDSERAEYVLKNSNKYFDTWGNFYVFSNADIACSYIIQASNESEAFSELITRFEDAFIIPDEEATEDHVMNDNGNYCNVEYLVLTGVIKGE